MHENIFLLHDSEDLNWFWFPSIGFLSRQHTWQHFVLVAVNLVAYEKLHVSVVCVLLRAHWLVFAEFLVNLVTNI